MPSRRQILAWPLLLLPASCAFLKTVPPDRIFALTPLPPAPLAPSNNPKIAVAAPTSLRVLDSARIVNRSSELEFQYYSGAAWADLAPTMLQSLMISSLRNRLQAKVTSDEFNSTGTPLTSDLQDFQIEPGNLTHITLVTSFAGQTKTFESRQNALSDRMTDLVAAFDQGFHDVMGQMAEWIASAPAVTAE